MCSFTRAHTRFPCFYACPFLSALNFTLKLGAEMCLYVHFVSATFPDLVTFNIFIHSNFYVYNVLLNVYISNVLCNVYM